MSEPPRAPDLFRALELEPARVRLPTRGAGPVGAPFPAAVEPIEEIEELEPLDSDPAIVRLALDDEDTRPRPRIPSEVAQVPVYASLAEELEPEGPVGGLADGEPVRTGHKGWWVALSVLLAGSLGYVLWAHTGLFEKVDELAADEAAEAAAPAPAAAAAPPAKEYGSVQIGSTPDGARVWVMKPGPSARFAGLPVEHAYQVLIDAPGHVPQVRTIKGSELGAPMVVDLDPVTPPGAAAPPLPELDPPRLDEGQLSGKTATLTVESPTAGAVLGLLVGFTPGAAVVDLDVRETHEFWISKGGFSTRRMVVKGRHFEEGPGGELIYAETVALVPAPAPAAAGDDAVIVEDDAEPVAAKPAIRPRAKAKKRGKRRRR